MLRQIGAILSGLSILAVGIAPRSVGAQGGAIGYVLDTESVSSLLGGADVSVGDLHYEDWDASMSYTLPDLRSFCLGQRVPWSGPGAWLG